MTKKKNICQNTFVECRFVSRPATIWRVFLLNSFLQTYSPESDMVMLMQSWQIFHYHPAFLWRTCEHFWLIRDGDSEQGWKVLKYQKKKSHLKSFLQYKVKNKKHLRISREFFTDLKYDSYIWKICYKKTSVWYKVSFICSKIFSFLIW